MSKSASVLFCFVFLIKMTLATLYSPGTHSGAARVALHQKWPTG